MGRLGARPDVSPRLKVDEIEPSSWIRRLSPARSWPEIAAVDAKVAEVEQRRTRISADLAALREQHAHQERGDREALAAWVASNAAGERPLPTAPTTAEQIKQAEQEHAAAETAIGRLLQAKVELVERHRKRLIKDAGAATEQAVKRMLDAIAEAETARNEAVAYVEATLWARSYPDPVDSLTAGGLQHFCQGRVPQAAPEIRSRLSAKQVLDSLREDATRLETAVADTTQEDGVLDPDREAIWEQTPEGMAAVARKNRSLAANAGWGQ